MKSFRLTVLALILSSLSGVSLAQPSPNSPPDAAPLLERMDAHMATMQQFHQQFQNATPEQRRALMAEHHKMMQEGMGLMGAASGHPNRMGMGGMMGGMNYSGPRGQTAAPASQTPSGLTQHEALMSKRMDMMQSMMQMMMDRMDTFETR